MPSPIICTSEQQLARTTSATVPRGTYQRSLNQTCETGIGGVGWVARDFGGIFNGVGGNTAIPCVSSLMTEAEAMRVVMVACVGQGFTSIQLETDSQVLVDMIHDRIQPETVLDGNSGPILNV
ncbi:hypothetical protein D8674_026734 [Pyrus ussuriensis x Pyrus communis]|uniref:RNase H type-1 domain-containing protein n=1 Tax=Pyrus ussuriensis x Pyrus communis TaxID=2448454 RepID=A0A5N5IEZ3_9ROSA|nr:hypothetical protein D8674_026734 [Pyrus ussuriensis x Pyrus communis]